VHYLGQSELSIYSRHREPKKRYIRNVKTHKEKVSPNSSIVQAFVSSDSSTEEVFVPSNTFSSTQ